jgi:hypothetical protein
MSSRLFRILSLFALFEASLSMLAEPVLEVLVDSPVHPSTDTDSDTDDDDDDSEKDSLLSEDAFLADTFALGCRVTLLSNVTTSSCNLAGDPRGPPASLAKQVATDGRSRTA